MWMKRSQPCSVALGLCAAALLAVAGCGQNGSYRLSWIFVDQTGTAQTAATGCGQFYVDSIMATGSDEGGDAQQIVALCTAGWVTADATPGTWSFSVQMLDSQGALIKSNPPPNMTMTTTPAPIESDGPPTQFSVVLWPL